MGVSSVVKLGIFHASALKVVDLEDREVVDGGAEDEENHGEVVVAVCRLICGDSG